MPPLATISALTPTPDQTITDPEWSKESLFALLGVVIVVLIPCLGMLLKMVIVKRRASKSSSKQVEGYSVLHLLENTILMAK